MEKFNNTTLFTGYLKQLLHNFNLPKYKIYTKAQYQYQKQFGIEREDIFKTTTKYSKAVENSLYPDNLHYVPYIREGVIQEYVDGEWINKGTKTNSKIFRAEYYDEGIKILNYTKNLKITTNAYDSYTHEYLGDYLRFQRDYNNINLMPLYNCFSNRTCEHLNFKWEELDKFGNTSIHSFDTTDTAYKIYMLPVKLFQEYTIAIDSDSPIEICCGMYGAYQDIRDKFVTIPKLTYKKFKSCKFASPILYSKLGLSPAAISPFKLDLSNEEAINLSECDFALKTFPQSLIDEISQNESCLKMFIKIPAACTSTIVILEGNYLNWNDRIVTTTGMGLKVASNNAVLNFESLPMDIPFELITTLQLLRFNTGEQHPFADRLIEYLTGNVITSADEINKNIARVQKVLTKRTQANKDFDQYSHKYLSYNYMYKNKGFWDDYIKYNIYDYINKRKNTYDVNHDILGFVDKDAEKYYYYHDNVNNTDVSIANVELDDEEVF